jgi:transposase InsO family protein
MGTSRVKRLSHKGWPCQLGTPPVVEKPGNQANAPMESFFAPLKKELVRGADFATRAEARAAVVEYIEVFYSTQRRHSPLGYVSPAAYEQTE